MTPFINIHSHHSAFENQSIISIFNANIDDNFETKKPISMGVHPWNIDKTEIENAIKQLNTECKNQKLAAIGEIGLDRIIEYPIHKQLDVFEQQRGIAEKFKLPIIIHCVKAYADFLGLLKQKPPKTPWIFHGFAANTTIAEKLIAKNCFLSFGEKLIKSKKLQNTFASVPVEHVFFETDESKTNIEAIYAKAANIKNVSVQDLKEDIYNNFCKVFSYFKFD